ncbi:hypothetical protein NEUTE1DRAFT_37129, partial [Neurospora tetrasperma FGSC 2508]
VKLLPIVQLVYNTSPIKTTKVLLFFINYGYELEFLEGLNTNIPRALIKAGKLYILYKKLKEELEFI